MSLHVQRIKETPQERTNMSASPAYVYSRELKLKVRVVNEEFKLLQKAKVGVDRDTTTFEKLSNHLAKTLKLSSKFVVTYQATTSEEGELTTAAILDDWDLDIALQRTRHSLKVTVQTFSDEPKSNGIHSNGNCVHSNGNCGHSNGTARVNDADKEQEDKVPSIFDRFMDKMEGLLSFHDSSPDAYLSRTKSPLTFREFQHYLDSEGRLANYQAFRESIFMGGVAPSMRKIAWRHLLCVFPEDLTADERIEYLKKQSAVYMELREEWKDEYKNNHENMTDHMRFVTAMVKKDVVRTDRHTSYYKGKEDNKHTMSLFDLLCTYALNHPNVSYCQGMCDLASPLLAVQDNEAHAYILFCALMQRVKYNFAFDSIAISVKLKHLTQLLMHFDPAFYSYLKDNQVDHLVFAYRWLLLEMKREFPFEDAMYFLEVMWSSLPTLPTKAEVPLVQPFTIAKRNSFANAKCEMEHDDDDEEEDPSDKHLPVTDEYQDDGHIVSESNQALEQDCIEEAIAKHAERDAVFSSEFYEKFGEKLIVDHQNNGFGQENKHTHVEDSYEQSEDGECGKCTKLLQEHCDVNEEYTKVVVIERETCEVVEKSVTKTGKRQGSDSADSGFGSRPGSPTQDEDGLAEDSRIIKVPVVNFPPPKEFGFGNPFLMFASLAMILEHRDAIMDKKLDFNDIVMLFSGYKSNGNVHKILMEAKNLYIAYINDGLDPDPQEFEPLNAE